MLKRSVSPNNKLMPVAEAVADLLQQEFRRPAHFSLEVELSWLNTLPSQEMLGDTWGDISNAYSSLVDHQFDLSSRIEQNVKDLRRSPQRVDVWFDPPYSFALEFDEHQHFNQYRLRTLEEYACYRDLPFDYDGYVRNCQSKTIKPGISGFTRLQAFDPLFPPLLATESQDNRVRQRAFRDLLKDVVPWVRPNTNPTLRIGSYVVGGKRKDFSDDDCGNIVCHIQELRALDQFRLLE